MQKMPSNSEVVCWSRPPFIAIRCSTVYCYTFRVINPGPRDIHGFPTYAGPTVVSFPPRESLQGVWLCYSLSVTSCRAAFFVVVVALLTSQKQKKKKNPQKIAW